MTRPTDFDPHYEEHKTGFARQIDRQVAELRNITNAYHRFIEHLATVERLLQAFAGKRSQPLIGDACTTCGVDGVSIRKAIQALANLERPN